jgi:hypothetical protein
VAPQPCPVGTFGAIKSLKSAAECTSCPAGSYCENPGSATVTGPCKAGFVCGLGSITSAPYDAIYDVETTPPVQNGRCPVGKYCPQGCITPLPCPAGSYNPDSGAAECRACDPGKYCETAGAVAPSGDCDAGYICKFGAKTSRPTDGVTGEICPVSFYCPAGSAAARTCQDGYKSTRTGQTACDVCEASKSCRAGAEVTCDNYKYCNDSAAYPYGRLCPAGSYLAPGVRGLGSSDDCSVCPAGKFCLGGRVSAGGCAPGYICKSGAPSPTPDGDSTSGAYPCPIGFYCPEGTETE